MKKFLSLFLVFTLIFYLASPAQMVNAKTEYSINKSKLSIYIGETYTLKISGYSNFIMWKSDNTKVVSVSSNGLIKAKKAGTATITATIGAGSNNKKFTCKVTVKNRLSVSKKSITTSLDEFEELKIGLKKPKKDESLLVMINDPSIIDTEWNVSKDGNTLIIVPKEVGFTEITICTITGSGLRGEINSDLGITIGVSILEDNSGWISKSALYKFDATASILDDIISLSFRESKDSSRISYVIENVPAEPEEDVIYKDKEISYKFINNTVYFKVSELKKLKLMRQ